MDLTVIFVQTLMTGMSFIQMFEDECVLTFHSFFFFSFLLGVYIYIYILRIYWVYLLKREITLCPNVVCLKNTYGLKIDSLPT